MRSRAGIDTSIELGAAQRVAQDGAEDGRLVGHGRRFVGDEDARPARFEVEQQVQTLSGLRRNKNVLGPHW